MSALFYIKRSSTHTKNPMLGSILHSREQLIISVFFWYTLIIMLWMVNCHNIIHPFCNKYYFNFLTYGTCISEQGFWHTILACDVWRIWPWKFTIWYNQNSLWIYCFPAYMAETNGRCIRRPGNCRTSTDLYFRKKMILHAQQSFWTCSNLGKHENALELVKAIAFKVTLNWNFILHIKYYIIL